MLIGRLTDSEHEVFHLLGHGLSNQEIASELFITERTVRAHLRSISNKLDLSSRLQVCLLSATESNLHSN